MKRYNKKKWTIKFNTWKYEKQINGQKFKYKLTIKSHNKNKVTIKAIPKCQNHKTYFSIS